jgi:hypothetical protein
VIPYLAGPHCALLADWLGISLKTMRSIRWVDGGTIFASMAWPATDVPLPLDIFAAQVKSNLEAQLLCCEPGTRCLLLSDCCLNCGVKEAIAMREVRRSTPVILIVS